jgi:hypothetical protein
MARRLSRHDTLLRSVARFGVPFLFLLFAPVRDASAEEPIFSDDFECDTPLGWSNGGAGGACFEDGDCLSGHCQNGFCCEGGDCCSAADDCAGYSSAPVCDDASSCQGSRVDATCGCAECGSLPVDDDSACTSETQASSCVPYLPVSCTGEADQTSPTCPESCVLDAECVSAAHCDGVCAFDLGLGELCNEASDCAAGTFCTDATCCAAACGGVCEACDLLGQEGGCAAIPSGQDPDAECGAVTCTGYYWGWTGSTCYRKADVSAGQASCNGSRACRSAAVECGAQATKGPAVLTCDSETQTPTNGTCTGTIAGSCTNL